MFSGAPVVAPSTGAREPPGPGGHRPPAVPTERQRPLGGRRGRRVGPTPGGGQLRRARRLRDPEPGRRSGRHPLRAGLVAVGTVAGRAGSPRAAGALVGRGLRDRGPRGGAQGHRPVARGRRDGAGHRRRRWIGPRVARPSRFAGCSRPGRPVRAAHERPAVRSPGGRGRRPRGYRHRRAGLRRGPVLRPPVGGRAHAGAGRRAPGGRSVRGASSQRGALGGAGAHPHGGAGRDGGASSRLRPPDTGADATVSRRPAADGATRPPPGARAPAMAVRRWP
jgi:hypothetical protein